MKKFIMAFLGLLLVAGFSGHTTGMESCPAAEVMPEAEQEVSQTVISSDMLGQGVYDALRVEWAAWEAKDELQRMVSSHLPGHCYKQFGTWAECEAFLGFELANPLEGSDFEKGTYVGMPKGYADASRFHVSLYGPNAEQVQWIFVDSGYRDGDVRITVNTQIFIDTPAGCGENTKPLISEDSGERYVASNAMVVCGPVIHNIRVIGEPNRWNEVRETLNKVLVYYDGSVGSDLQTSVSTEEAGIKQSSLRGFLEAACLPVGQTMYVWGGGWNEEDTGAGTEAVTVGVSPVWEAFAATQDATYSMEETRYQIHDGLDCSGYVGWAVYNAMETENGKEGYVLSSTKMAKEFASRGLGEYIPAEELSNWQPGDVMSMKGHAWISLGMCEDGSVLLLHSSPPGVSFCGTKLADGSKSMAVLLAEHIMKTYYPEWYTRYPKCAASYSYLTKSSAMRWSREVLNDEEGFATMSAEQVISALFERRE